MVEIRVQAEAFDPGAAMASVGAGDPRVGGVVAFTGVVREDGGLRALEIEHYPGMTERAIRAFAEEAVERFGLRDCAVIHRHGRLAVGEAIMMVATAAPHRADAFAAAEFLMDWLKSRAPFWKREVREGGASWVEARDEDEAALRRW
jgi:molybdopterin synthase catalytic subunit